MVNACVSHEMKNPINSIQGYNLRQEEIAGILLQLAGSNKSLAEIKDKMTELATNLLHCTKV